VNLFILESNVPLAFLLLAFEAVKEAWHRVSTSISAL
jgi:hypothetical protein